MGGIVSLKTILPVVFATLLLGLVGAVQNAEAGGGNGEIEYYFINNVDGGDCEEDFSGEGRGPIGIWIPDGEGGGTCLLIRDLVNEMITIGDGSDDEGDNITIDGDGHNVYVTDPCPESAAGIEAFNSKNVRVTNVNLWNWTWGVYFDNIDGGSIDLVNSSKYILPSDSILKLQGICIKLPT